MIKTKFNKARGFTLVELLVVVAIIAILSTIGLTIFTSAQANARDARRKADIEAIANALETTRSPGTLFYTNLPTTAFSGGAVPVDTTTAKYSIRTSTVTTVPDNPTTWAATSANPTAPAAATGESAWTSIPSTGFSATAVPFGNGTAASNIISWKVCARLETGTFYCKPSSQ